ncbi:hypothetical protein [Desulfonatronovibrio hydrogenovorans]|uniref:hypothetical protein n=1 Tax=Desulfonatronovibrio hydrogenovorans TaxID=53245 RepID=UPI00048B6330|nr:hypothetical protein [Desulfonatronovibrio hydrogenovorans]
MIVVIGQYVKTFAEASHVLFDGPLDEPNFSRIAIQAIADIGDGFIATRKSGKMQIIGTKQEKVYLTYESFLGKKIKTAGYPFKDNVTKAIK